MDEKDKKETEKNDETRSADSLSNEFSNNEVAIDKAKGKTSQLGKKKKSKKKEKILKPALDEDGNLDFQLVEKTEEDEKDDARGFVVYRPRKNEDGEDILEKVPDNEIDKELGERSTPISTQPTKFKRMQRINYPDGTVKSIYIDENEVRARETGIAKSYGNGVSKEIRDGMDAVDIESLEKLREKVISDPGLLEACSRRIDFINKLRIIRKKKCKLSDLDSIREKMDESHHGLNDLKDYFMNQVDYFIRYDKTPRPTLLVGAPGCGKTSLTCSFADAFGVGYRMISVGGETGSGSLKGETPQWKGAKEGLIMDAFIQTQCLNPVIIIDEIDKMGTSQEYGTPCDALLPILDKDQSKYFVDSYLTFPFDISNAWIILTANDIEKIPEPIQNRCNIINVPSFSLEMKEEIFKNLVERKNKNEIAPSSIEVTDEAVSYIVTGFCSDAGARDVTKYVDRLFEEVCMKFPRNRHTINKKISIEEAKRIFPRMQNELHYSFTTTPGIVPGIAVNMITGLGMLMPIEAKVVPMNDERFLITGQVKSVMQESAEVAVGYADYLWLEREGKRIGEVTLNYPFPFPKDGESGGLATTIAILSAAMKRPVRPKTSITGAVSLSGQVLQVSGIMAKVRATIDAGYTDVVIPKSDEHEWMELPLSERQAINVHLVETVKEAVAFLLPEPETK